MKLFNFSLVLAGVTPDTPDLEDALFESGCDDGLVCSYGESVFIEFDRESDSLELAIVSAIHNIEHSTLDATVISVDGGDYVGLSDIAELSNLTRQSIALFKDGKRGGGQFPSPVLRLEGKQPLWRWGQVASWLAEQGKISNELAEQATLIETINLALELRQPKKQDAVMTMAAVLA